MKELMEQIALCNECEACQQVCPTYRVNQDVVFSPIGRIRAAGTIFSDGEVTPQMMESVYTCLECSLCTDSCPYEIDVSEIVHQSRVKLAKRELGPPEAHSKVLAGIQKVGNSVNGDPAKNLDWLPEEPSGHESSTLFYAGCLASYLVKDAAASAYLVLRKLGVDFMVLPNEGCCGIYFKDVGRLDLAREKFAENSDRFKKLGINRIITVCAGCYQCFKRFYPELLGKSDFDVVHVAELLPSRLKEAGIKVVPKGLEVTYQDSCRMGRSEGIYQEPREALELCGVKVIELAQNRGNAPCCGGGAGVRTVNRELCLNIASQTLNQAPAGTILTACSFCQFNFNYAVHKTASDKKIAYFTEVILQALS